MPTLRVISPGFQTTVQDKGRFGFAHLGVSPAGPADPVAFRLGNLLVSNEGDAPALEMTLIGGIFEFASDSVVAVTGGNCEPTLERVAIPIWTSMLVQAGQTLHCGPTRDGARSYLCVHGGIKVPKLLGSASTHLQTGIGGWHGRALKKGDMLSIGGGPTTPQHSALTVRKDLLEYLQEKSTVRVTRAPQSDFFSAEWLRVFSSASYTVSEESNRVGLRLIGNRILCERQQEMITEGVSVGAVQVPGSGQPIILFVEHPTTGGYPKIANVISADLCRIGQLRPRDQLRFKLVSFEEAHKLLQQQYDLLGKNSLVPM